MILNIKRSLSGRSRHGSFEDEEARIHCESVQTSIRKTGLQRAHSRSCNHVLYDPATCKATSAPYLSTGIITAVENAGQRIKMTLVPDRPADWFTAGELIHPDGPRTMVLTHTNIGGGVHQMDLSDQQPVFLGPVR